jgi:hypothetical protein
MNQFQNAISELVESLQYGKRSKNDPSKTPAKPSERRRGSDKNKKGSSKKPNNSIKLSKAQEEGLKNKVKEHNEKHGDKQGKKVTLGMLKSVWRRGAGAFSSSHRPDQNRSSWAMARVNAFLYLVRSGKPSNSSYVQDNDLLPPGHPKKS